MRTKNSVVSTEPLSDPSSVQEIIQFTQLTWRRPENVPEVDVDDVPPGVQHYVGVVSVFNL